MNLVKFIDNRFQELRIREAEEDKRKEYSVTRDGEVMALQAVLRTYRTTVKWLMIPKVFFHFFATYIGLAQEPKPVLIDKLKADMKVKQKELDKKAGKLGFAKPVSNVSDINGEQVLPS